MLYMVFEWREKGGWGDWGGEGMGWDGMGYRQIKGRVTCEKVRRLQH